jgi:iron complex outermembrane recepter protein
MRNLCLFKLLAFLNIAVFSVEYLRAEDTVAPHSELTSILITADPLRPSLLEYSKPASVMERDEIVQRAGTSLGDTLQNQPGVSSSYFGPAAGRPVIRGFSGERIRILRNGIGSFDVSNTSEDHQVTVNPLNADSIEVLRGPETLLYGNSAIGGVVNMTDSSIAEKNVGRDVRGEALFRGESVDDELTGAAKLEGQVGQFNWHLSGLSQDTENIRIPGDAESKRLQAQEADLGEAHEEDQARGRLDNSFSKVGTYTLGGSYVWDQGFWGASFTQYDSRYGIPGHMHGEEDHHEEEDPHEEEEHFHEEDNHDEEESLPVIDMKQWRVDSRGAVYNVSDDIDQIRVRFGLAQYEHAELEGATAGTRFENSAFEARGEVFHNTIAGSKGVVGSQIEAGDFKATGDEAFVPGFRRIAPALFVYEQYAVSSALDYLLGGRYEFNQIDAEGFETRDFQPIAGSTGLSWDMDGLKKYVSGLNLAYTERAPSGYELYADGIHAARQIYERGDAELSKERALGIDLTFKKNTGLVTGGINLFAQHFFNYINLAPTAEDLEGFDVFAYQQVRARFAGFEVESTFHVHDLADFGPHHFDLTAQFDYVRAQNLTDNNDVPRIPPFRTVLKAAYDWQERVFATIEGVLAAAQHNTAETELTTDAYQLLNASLEYKLPLAQEKSALLFLRGVNLTDEEARLHTSFVKDLAPLPGRSVLAGLQISF